MKNVLETAWNGVNGVIENPIYDSAYLQKLWDNTPKAVILVECRCTSFFITYRECSETTVFSILNVQNMWDISVRFSNESWSLIKLLQSINRDVPIVAVKFFNISQKNDRRDFYKELEKLSS